MGIPNAVYRVAKNAELIPFVYRYDEFFGQYLFPFHRTFYPKLKHKPIPFSEVVNYLMQYDDAIGAFNDNNISVNVIFPDHEENNWLDPHSMFDCAPIKRIYSPYDEILEGYHEQIPVAFMRTELIAAEVKVLPWKIYKDTITGEFNRYYKGIEFALEDPPNSLFIEMNDKKMDYAWIDSRTGKAVFGRDPSRSEPPVYLDDESQKYTSMLSY